MIVLVLLFLLVFLVFFMFLLYLFLFLFLYIFRPIGKLKDFKNAIESFFVGRRGPVTQNNNKICAITRRIINPEEIIRQT